MAGIVLGSNFENGDCYHNNQYRSKWEQVRISLSERYTSNFTPNSNLICDSETYFYTDFAGRIGTSDFKSYTWGVPKNGTVEIDSISSNILKPVFSDTNGKLITL